MIKAEVNKRDVNVIMDGYIGTIAAESLQIVNYIYNAIVKDYDEESADGYVNLVREFVASDEFAKKKEKTMRGDVLGFSTMIKRVKKTGTNVPEQKNVPPMPGFLKERPPIGCRPAHVAATGRIEELAGAIQRQAASDAPDIEKIKTWNAEISAQIRLMEETRE